MLDSFVFMRVVSSTEALSKQPWLGSPLIGSSKAIPIVFHSSIKLTSSNLALLTLTSKSVVHSDYYACTMKQGESPLL